LTPALVEEGLARDLVRAIQDRRKDIGCDFTDRIHVSVSTADVQLKAAVKSFQDYIVAETLADSLTAESLPKTEPQSIKVGDAAAELYVQVAR
jgi:isoleucyl-tRNA synthetase